ncbi:MAG: hypothetical protein QOI67_1076 [Gaiellaceae bacterium]|nr:hypothetical protein [Gaiellaceae bacterium]
MRLASPIVRRLPGRVRQQLTRAGLERRIVWILGSPRSGTTWLGSLLAMLTSATLIDEPLLGAHLAVPVAAVTSVPTATDPLLYEASASNRAYFFSTKSKQAWQPGLRSLVLRRFAWSVVEGGSASGPVLVKEPNGSLGAPLLLPALPRSRLLFVVRDGRDVVDSLVDGAAGGWITETHGSMVDEAGRQDFIERRAHHWVRTVDAVKQAYDSHDAGLRLQVTYEALRADTNREVERILRWLGRDDALPAMPALIEKQSFENLPSDQTGAGRFARSATPGLWREHFSGAEQQRLEEIMGPVLGRLGYEVGQ